jgi:hypothetical protein
VGCGELGGARGSRDVIRCLAALYSSTFILSIRSPRVHSRDTPHDFDFQGLRVSHSDNLYVTQKVHTLNITTLLTYQDGNVHQLSAWHG